MLSSSLLPWCENKDTRVEHLVAVEDLSYEVTNLWNDKEGYAEPLSTQYARFLHFCLGVKNIQWRKQRNLNMHQIRARPKDQSSDEDENEEQQQSATSIKPAVQTDVDTQSVSKDIDDLKQPDDENNDVSTVHSDENADDQQSIDFSMFKSKRNECGGNDKENGITCQCDALQRLGIALRVYAVLSSMGHGLYNGDDDEMEPEIPTFSEFIGREYRVQFDIFLLFNLFIRTVTVLIIFEIIQKLARNK